MSSVAFELNGRPVTVDAGPDQTLLSLLRDALGLTGTKRGCDSGECGACTVLVDGLARRSCHVKATAVGGRRVETIEGLETEGRLHPLQAAFLAEGAVQCGFCTPGMIMAAKGLLDRGGQVSAESVKAALRHNLCRCTGYASIVQAVMRVASGTQDDESTEDLSSARPSMHRQKATGAARFAGDLRPPEGMLHAAIVWSAVPHGRLTSLDVGRALRHPGVVTVLTAADVPGTNGIGLLKPDQPVLVDRVVRRVGEPLALVVANTEAAARAAGELVKAVVEPLPVVGSIEESLAPEAPLLSAGGNVLKEFTYADGDLDEGFASSTIVAERHYRTPFVEHAYLETETTLADVDSSGRVLVWTGTQYPFETREQIAQVLGVANEAVQVTVTPIGGSFGGKTDMHVSVALAVLAAFVLGRPVRLALERRESIASSTKRHAFEMDFRIGLDEDGKILAADVEVLSDAGPYTGQSQWVMEQACIFACGPYRVQSSRVRGRAVRTNNCSGGAFRGYGINQVAFALESLLDECAERLGIDPLELRLRNVLTEGDRTVAGETLRGHVGAGDTLRACREALPAIMPAEPVRDGWSRGIGVACAYKNVGWGRGSIDDGHARLQLAPDGQILLWTSAADMGQGADKGLTKLAAEALGFGPEVLRSMPTDTQCLPRGNGGSAQRLTFCAGNAVLATADRFRSLLLEHVERLFGIPASQSVRNGGGALRYATPEGSVTLRLCDVSEALEREGTVLSVQESYVAPRTYSLDERDQVPSESYRLYPAYSYCTSAAVVEVERETGKVRVTDLAVFQDVGHTIDRRTVRGQLEGSCLQALGYALTERYRLAHGLPLDLSLGKLSLPRIEDIPRYHTELIESVDLHGPMGAKGISEVAMVPACPAITNAVAAATGIRGRSLPLRP